MEAFELYQQAVEQLIAGNRRRAFDLHHQANKRYATVERVEIFE